MKQILTFTVALILLTACTSAPTATPTVAPTAALAHTATPLLTATALPTNTLTVTPSPTTLPTIVPSPSQKLPTERPSEIVWTSPHDLTVNADNQWTTKAWSDRKEIAGVISIEDDPIKGPVLRYEKTAEGTSLMRAQVGKSGEPLSMPFEMTYEVFIEPSFRFEGNGSKWLNLGGFFAPGSKPGGIDDIPYYAIGMDEFYRPYFDVKNPDGVTDKEKQIVRPITVKKNEWIKIKIVAESGIITTYINDSVLYVAKSDRLLRSFHMGDLYGDGIAKGSVIKHGDITLRKLK